MWYKSLLHVPSLTMNSPNSSAALQLFTLDGDDLDLDTSLDTAPFAPTTPREESFVGTLPARSPRPVEEAVRSRHESLALAIADLEKVCDSFDSVDVSARPRRLRCAAVSAASPFSAALSGRRRPRRASRTHEVFAGEGTLAPYLAGVYLWAGDVTETLGTLARDLNALTPNWSAFRERLDDVAWICDMARGRARPPRSHRRHDARRAPRRARRALHRVRRLQAQARRAVRLIASPSARSPRARGPRR